MPSNNQRLADVRRLTDPDTNNAQSFLGKVYSTNSQLHTLALALLLHSGNNDVAWWWSVNKRAADGGQRQRQRHRLRHLLHFLPFVHSDFIQNKIQEFLGACLAQVLRVDATTTTTRNSHNNSRSSCSLTACIECRNKNEIWSGKCNAVFLFCSCFVFVLPQTIRLWQFIMCYGCFYCCCGYYCCLFAVRSSVARYFFDGCVSGGSGWGAERIRRYLRLRFSAFVEVFNVICRFFFPEHRNYSLY